MLKVIRQVLDTDHDYIVPFSLSQAYVGLESPGKLM